MVFSEVHLEATCWQLPSNGKIPNTDNALNLIQRVPSCISRRLGRWLVEILSMGIGGGIVGIILLPILYGIAGVLSGLIVALLYNLVASVVGGIKFETR